MMKLATINVFGKLTPDQNKLVTSFCVQQVERLWPRQQKHSDLFIRIHLTQFQWCIGMGIVKVLMVLLLLSIPLIDPVL